MMTDDHHNERKHSLQTTGAEFKSQLTCQEKLLSKGNKNGNGLCYGLDNGTSRSEYVKNAVAIEPSDFTSDISMVDSNILLNGNCSLHSSFLVPQSSTNDSVYTHVVEAQGPQFGFIPQGPLKLYVGDPVSWEYVPNVNISHLLIRSSGLPNYLGCRIPVQSQLNIDNWKRYLVGYWDNQITGLLQYGFPCALTPTETDHTSALKNASHVLDYISEELQFGIWNYNYRSLCLKTYKYAHFSPHGQR